MALSIHKNEQLISLTLLSLFYSYFNFYSNLRNDGTINRQIMNKYYIITIIFILGINTVFAQRSWLDYNSRSTQYPDNTYLIGFASEGQIDDVSGDYFNILGDVARKKLIESIQVKIQSRATLEVENINSKTHEHFKQQSVSVSQANIVGLKYETYYDKKNKDAYAFCYAKKSEVITYYKNIIATKKESISKKIQEASSSISVGDNPNALKTYYAGMKMLREIDEAQYLLVALGFSNNSDLYIDEVSNYESKIKNGIASLSNSKNLSLADVSEFMAYGLKLQSEKLNESISLGKITYQDTGLSSKFSNRFNDIFKQKLVNVSKYNISDKKNQQLFISGTYWKEGSKLKIITDLKSKEKGKIIASVETRLPISWLKENNIAYLPESIKKLDLLNQIELRAIKAKREAKIGKTLIKPLEVSVSLTDGSIIENIPIKFSFMGKNGKKLGTVRSSKSGMSKFHFEKFTSDKKIQIIKAELDIVQFIGIGAESGFYHRIIQDYSVPSAVKFVFKVSGLLVYVEVNEKNLGRIMEIPFIEPAIKESLSGKGYAFTDDLSEADYMIEIKSNSRSANSYSGIYFSYVDTNIAITDLENDEEVYKGSFSDIKGAGNNYRQAGIKAYKNVVKKVKKGVLDALVKK